MPSAAKRGGNRLDLCSRGLPEARVPPGRQVEGIRLDATHDVQVQMKYGLLARVSARQKERLSLGAEQPPLASRDLGAQLEHVRQFLRSRIGEFDGMPSGNDERMPLAER